MSGRGGDDLSDLVYEWPVDVLHYETRYFLGLTLNELLIISLPAIALLMAYRWLGAAALFLAVLAAGTGLLLLKRFDTLGGRSAISYLVARAAHSRRPDRSVRLPLILPPEGGAIVIETWEGEELLRIGDEE